MSEAAVARPPGSPSSGTSLLAGARECSRAVSVLAYHSSGVRPFAILAAHSVELALKAFLRHRGRSDDQLRAMGHNLLDAWSAASDAGLAIGADVPSWVQSLNSVHDQPFFGRYPPANSGLVTPNARQLEFHLTELLEIVARTCRCPAGDEQVAQAQDREREHQPAAPRRIAHRRAFSEIR